MDRGDRICFTKMHEIFLLLPKGGEERQRVLICFLFCVAYIFLHFPFAMGTSKQTPIQVGRRKRKKSGGSRSVVVLVLALIAIIKKWNGAWHEKKNKQKK